MDVYRLKDLPEDDRKTVLLGESLSVEKQAYMRQLTPEELAIKKDELAVAAINKAYIEDELAEVKKQYKEKTEPLRLKVAECILAIKNKAVEVNTDVYKLADYDNQMIHNVDPAGHVLSSRRMLPEERNFRISFNKEAANG